MFSDQPQNRHMQKQSIGKLNKTISNLQFKDIGQHNDTSENNMM